MSEKVLRLAPGLSIPAEQFITSATALIGKRGAGKSGGVKVIEEELFRVGLPFITLDPVGVHWGIRSSYDGNGVGLPVLVIGGEHGDIRLDRRAGAETARAILDANVSCVIDFSEEPKSAYREFVRDFAREVYAKKASPRVIIIEEAPELVPQKFRPDMTEVKEAVERLVSRGRNKGLGVVLVSQRAATIDKDVLTQIDNLFVGRLLSPQDRKALGEWVEAWDVQDKFGEFMAALASLPTRTMYLWSPETLKHFGQIRFKDFHTLHGDRTHLNRLGLLETKPVTTDVTAVVKKLGQTMERFAKEKADVAELPRLRAEVQRLRAEREQWQAGGRVRDVDLKAVQEAKARIGALESETRILRKSLSLANRTIERAREMGTRLKELEIEEGLGVHLDLSPTPPLLSARSESLLDRKHSGTQTADGVGAASVGKAETRAEAPLPVVVRHRGAEYVNADLVEGVHGNDPNGKLYSGESKMLREVVRATLMGKALTRAQLGTLSGYSPKSSTAKTYVSHLKRMGLIVERGGALSATDEGRERNGPITDVPATPRELLAMWEGKLYSGESKMLRMLVDMKDGGLTRQQLGDLSGYSTTSSTFKTYASHLKRLRIVTEEGGVLRAVEELWN